jgi:hypothetical protein
MSEAEQKEAPQTDLVNPENPDQVLDSKPDISSSELEEEQALDSTSPEAQAPEQSSGLKNPNKRRFWKSWPTKKKLIFCLGILSGILLLFLLITFFIIKPSKTSSYLNSSWHDLVLNSSDIDRAVSSEVNLAGTRNLADGLYTYNQHLGSASFEAKGKSSFWYGSGATKDYSSTVDQMRDYFSDAATTLAKSNDNITEITEQELTDLGKEGQAAKQKVDQFRTKHKLQEDLNPNLFSLDNYIREVKAAYEKIEKEKKEEEDKKTQEAAEKAAKEAKDKASVQSVSSSYFSAFVNGNEAGVKSTLSKGFQTEYDYDSLKAESRTSYFPKSYRIIAVDKDGDNYKVTASVTYVSRYTDSSGNQQETVYPVTMVYRVVYAMDTSSWKIDGQLDR